MATLTQQAPWSQPFAQPAHTVSDANKTEPAQQLTLAHQAYRWSNPSMYTVHARPHFRSASSSDSSLSTMQKMPVYVDSSRSRSAPVIGKEIYPHSAGNTLPQKFTIHGDHITSFQEDGAKAQTYGRVIRTIESVSSPSLRELTGGRQIVQKLRQPLPLSAPSELAAEAPKRHNRHHSLDSKAGVIRAAGLTNATTPPARPPSLNSSCSPNPMSPSNGDVKKTERSSSTTAFHPAPVKPTLSTPPPSPLQSKTSNDEPGRPRASSPSPVRRVRGSSVDSTASSVKSRTYGPSPLSQPQFETSPPRSATPEPTVLISPEKTTIRNRLRRALSFGAKNELNKTPLKAQNEEKVPSVNAGPPDASIYGRKFFAISTDNLSIASTASSASLMLRKMGKGMKNGGKNFSEIFRQKRRVEPIVNKRETLDVSSEEEDVQRQATSPEIEDVRLGTPKPSNAPLEDDVRRRKSFAAGRPSIEKRRILRRNTIRIAANLRTNCSRTTRGIG